MSSLLLAWTAAIGIIAALIIIVFMVALRIMVVKFTSGRPRLWADFLFALIDLVLLYLLSVES